MGLSQNVSKRIEGTSIGQTSTVIELWFECRLIREWLNPEAKGAKKEDPQHNIDSLNLRTRELHWYSDEEPKPDEEGDAGDEFKG